MPIEATTDAPTQPDAARGDFVVRQGTFFQVGEYPDKQFSLTEAEADAAIARFAPVPLNIEHIPTIFDGKLGMVRRIWREGKNLLAEYVIPRWLHDVTQGAAIKISSEWSRSTKQAQGGAFVLHPRVADAVMLAAFHHTVPDTAHHTICNAAYSATKEGETMSLLSGLKALFQRAGVPASEIDAQLCVPSPDTLETTRGAAFEATERESPTLTSHSEPDGEQARFADAARFAQMEAELARLREEARQAQDTQNAARFTQDAQAIEILVRGGQMTPAEADAWEQIARDKPAAFAVVLPALQARPRLPHVSGVVVRASQSHDADRLETLTRQRMRDRGLEHAQAFREVCGENKELALSVRSQSQEGS